MNPIVVLLAFATFATGTAENIIVGIVSDVAGELGVSIAFAGQLTAVFSIVFALTAPLALVLTMKIERRRLLLCALGLFVVSNLCAAASPNFATLVVARIGMAMASATVCLLATMLATELVAKDMKGRAIGIIFMGISGSLVLGVPAGIFICGLIGWRGVFIALSLLAGLVWLASWRHVPVSARRKAALPTYLDHLRKPPLVAGQFVSILMIGGHFVLFAFLGPYLVEIASVAAENIAIAFAVLGIAGVSGGYLGGWLADRSSPRNVLLLTPTAYLLALVTTVGRGQLVGDVQRADDLGLHQLDDLAGGTELLDLSRAGDGRYRHKPEPVDNAHRCRARDGSWGDRACKPLSPRPAVGWSDHCSACRGREFLRVLVVEVGRKTTRTHSRPSQKPCRIIGTHGILEYRLRIWSSVGRVQRVLRRAMAIHVKTAGSVEA
ncbi:MFS transporter [Ensifer sp. ENS06]|uniref:MFS transporter n=1 Tax=Ensifer sp. ENS06 TaxID=2769276 RepID=UPI001FEF5CA0|nr:MFS transporter [Ensifer sp. ENS06]